MSNFKNTLLEVLKTDSRIWFDQELDVIKVKDLADKYDEKFIEILLNNEETRKYFFMQIKDIYVFKQNEFKFFLDENKLDNSYTSFANQIGLYNNSKLLRNTGEVVLNWPFKDCVLEGGQSSEEGTDTFFEFDENSQDFEEKTSKRKEIFFNEILARDEIDRLEEKKALNNFKRFTKDGLEEVGSFKRDAEINKKRGLPEDTITDNLIIKGNNLLALHSIKKEFAGKVKLIYIDPPYNTGNDGFKYNDNFNHSSWLTFMKNRLEIAKELLRDDGVIFVQISDKEVGYLNVLMNEIFLEHNFINKITLSTKSPSGFKIVNLGLFETAEYILLYGKNKKNWIYNTQYEKCGYDENYNLFIENVNSDYSRWNIKTIDEVLSRELGFDNIKECKKELGIDYYLLKKSDFALKKAENVCRLTRINNDAGKETLEIMEKSKNDNIIYCLNRDKLDNRYIYKGQAITFYKNKVKILNGELTSTTLLTNIWKDIAYEGISTEGKVTLNNGKKPEKLLKRVIEISTQPGDIVLDYHLGSGTTGAVAHKMGRQYIGIEQMDYIETISVERLKKVIEGEQGGISKVVNFTGGGEFVYFELAKWNEEAKEKINECNSLEELEKFFEEMYEKYFLNYNLKIKEFKEKLLLDEKFKNLSLDKQKYIFLKMLDLNQMYVNFDERNDIKYNLSEDDIKLSEDFYNVNN